MNGHEKRSEEKINNENGHDKQPMTNGDKNHHEQTPNEPGAVAPESALSEDSATKSNNNDSNNNNSRRNQFVQRHFPLL